jgi:hypothetical protein
VGEHPLPVENFKTRKVKDAMRNLVARLFVVMAIAAVTAFGADNSLGTWKLNAAKSKSASSNPAKSRIMLREATPDGAIKVTNTGQLADGSASNYSYTCKYDGKECPVTGGPFDAITLKQIDANSWSFETRKTNGKYHRKGQTIISKDGKTLTQTSTGTDAEGKSFSQTQVFDKQ